MLKLNFLMSQLLVLNRFQNLKYGKFQKYEKEAVRL